MKTTQTSSADFKSLASELVDLVHKASAVVDETLPRLHSMGMGVGSDDDGIMALQMDSNEFVTWDQVVNGETNTGGLMDVKAFTALFPTAEDLDAFVELCQVVSSTDQTND